MTTTSEYIQNGQAQLLQYANALANLNAALTSLGIAVVVSNPTVASLATTIANVTITTTTG